MRIRTLGILLLALLLLTGCQREDVKISETEPTAVYDWMAGESPVPNRRIGVRRAGLHWEDNRAVSPTGVYFCPNVVVEHDEGYSERTDDTYILYADHGRDAVYKLCGRSDCTHDNADCNAYLYDGSDLTYYQGHLYAVTGEGPWKDECKLVRMEPDGSGHVDVFDFLAFAKEQGGEFVQCQITTDGYCVFSVYGWKVLEDDSIVDNWMAAYKYKLDGSMKKPKKMGEEIGMPLYHCGDSLVTLTDETVDGKVHTYVCTLDVATEEATRLTKHPSPGGPVWFGEQAAYYFRDGAIMRLSYDSGDEEVMVDTGLEGKYYAHCFPDCLMLVSRDSGEDADRKLYFYNWAFELVDTVELDYPMECSPEYAILAETAEQVILTDQMSDGQPLYYIDKSELGSGNVQIHEFKYGE